MKTQQFVDLLVRGNLTITTEIVKPEKADVSLRTVIFFDGDVVTWVAGADPGFEDWEQHQKEIDKFISIIRWLRRVLHYGWLVLSAVFMAISGTIYGLQGKFISLLISWVVIPVFFYVARWGAVKLLGVYLRHKIEAYTRGLLALPF